jgi:hypothetical protein
MVAAMTGAHLRWRLERHDGGNGGPPDPDGPQPLQTSA